MGRYDVIAFFNAGSVSVTSSAPLFSSPPLFRISDCVVTFLSCEESFPVWGAFSPRHCHLFSFSWPLGEDAPLFVVKGPCRGHQRSRLTSLTLRQASSCGEKTSGICSTGLLTHRRFEDLEGEQAGVWWGSMYVRYTGTSLPSERWPSDKLPVRWDIFQTVGGFAITGRGIRDAWCMTGRSSTAGKQQWFGE